MNVSLRKQFLFLLLFALAGPLASWGQTVNKSIFQEQPFDYQFRSEPNSPSLVNPPDNGSVGWVQNAPFQYTLTYTPNEDFIGYDTMRLVTWKKTGPVSQPNSITFYITVEPSKVDAVPDYATTPIDQPVSVNVLQNDFSSNGVLILKNIPLVNSGTASIEGDSVITFTPSPGFEGIAYLNYVVCDDIGVCDNGTVSFFVLGESASLADTVSIYTRKNQPQAVFVPAEYVLTQQPGNGTYDDTGDVPTYFPDADFVGNDYINFDYQGVPKVIEVRVLDLVANAFAFDDRAYMTPSEGTIEINVLENDLYGANSGCFRLSSDAKYGSVEWEVGTDARGVVRYTPPEGFSGVDYFTYSICPQGGNGNNLETATVYVFVSNYEPSASTFRMTTPKVTPLVVGYSVPIDQFSFSIEAQADLGTVTFLRGQADTVIYGQRIEGYNLILYIPDADVSSGFDEFELNYCVLTDGACGYQKTVKIEVEILDIGDGSEPMCFDDCVWSGDTNFDGVVDMRDLLPIGLAMGKVGIPRDEVNFDVWYGQYGDDWEAPFEAAPIDLKHLDTDGDSVITALDTFAISKFYGNTHSMTAVNIPFLEHEIVLGSDIFVSPGDLVELPMSMGSLGSPASNVYGFTFPFQYNPDIVEPESVDIDFENSSWLAYNSPILQMERNNLQGQVDAGFTRTNGLAADGLGRIGAIRFIISDDIDGFRSGKKGLQMEVGGGMATVMNSAGMMYGVRVRGLTVHIVPPSEREDLLDPSLLKVFPNPANGSFVNVYLNGGQEFERVVIYGLTGRRVYDTGKVLARRMQLPVSQLKNGMYFLSVTTAEGVLNKKFEVLR